MKYKQLKLCALLLLCLALTGMQAQESILASGGEASGVGGSLSYSVGQVVYILGIGTNGSEAPGIQQPYEISIATGLEESNIDLKFCIYPNPTADLLILELNGYKSSALSIQLYDMQGKLLRTSAPISNRTNIKMKDLPTSTYFLRISDSQKTIKTFKIIKK